MMPLRRQVTPRRIGLLALLLAGAATCVGGAASAAAPEPADAGRPLSSARWWLGFADNPGDQRQLAIHLDAPTAIDVRVRAAALSLDVRVRVEPGTTTVVDVPLAAMQVVGPPGAHGISVSHEGPDAAAAGLSVRGLNRRPNSSDAFLALPERGLGSTYRLLGYPGLRGAPTSQALIVATRDGTSVQIEATADCPAGEARLAAGEAWLHACADVSGARLTASAPVAVFGGSACAEVPDEAEFCSHLVEQLPAVTDWGQQFIALPSPGRKSDRLRLLADQDGTEVRIDGALIATLAAGAFHERVLEAPALIETSRPVLVAQYGAGSSVDAQEGDPFMALVPATAQYARQHRFGMPALPMDPGDAGAGLAFPRQHLSLFAPAEAIGQLRLDGNPVPASSFVAVGNGAWRAAQIPVGPGSHRLESALPVGSLVQGSGFNDSYALPGALQLQIDRLP